MCRQGVTDSWIIVAERGLPMPSRQTMPKRAEVTIKVGTRDDAGLLTRRNSSCLGLPIGWHDVALMIRARWKVLFCSRDVIINVVKDVSVSSVRSLFRKVGLPLCRRLKIEMRNDDSPFPLHVDLFVSHLIHLSTTFDSHALLVMRKSIHRQAVPICATMVHAHTDTGKTRRCNCIIP